MAMDAQPRLKIATPVLITVIVLMAVCLAGGTVFYHLVEKLSLIDAFYFSSMTLTTVGYGDFVPRTNIGKIFTSVFAFMGIGVFLGSAAVLFQTVLVRIHRIHTDFKNNHSK